VSQADVDRIRKGRGPIDMAEDCTALAGLFRKQAGALRGKTGVTVKQVERAAEVGARLQTLLKPKGLAKKGKVDPALADAVQVRDAFWAEVLRRHERLWSAGACVFGWKVDEHVPALQSRVAPQKRKKEAGSAEAPPKAGEAPPSPR
jgi:hypothetical protein